MAFNTDLLTRNFVYDNAVVVSSPESVANVNNTKDGDHDTFAAITRAAGNARLAIDLGAARTVDRIWVKSNTSGTPALTLEHGGSAGTAVWGNSITLTSVFNTTSGSLNYQYHSFTETSARHWRLNITDQATLNIYEVFLMDFKQTLTGDDAPRIYEISFSDPKGINLILADGTASHGTVYPQGRTNLMIDFSHLTKSMRDNLYTLYKNRVADGLCVLVYYQLTPEYIRQYVWDNEVGFSLNINPDTKQLATPYYQGKLLFREAF